MSRELKALLVGTALYYGHEIPDEVLLMYVADLRDLPHDRVARALQELRRDPKVTRCPMPAQIRERAGDGRPGPEEAWAMLPKDEHSSIVWTEEMAQAYGIVRGMMDGDQVAARMAFREAYMRLVAEARGSGRPTKWTPSFGHDPKDRIAAVREAFDRKRISGVEARAMLPEPVAKPGQSLLAGPDETPDPEGQEKVRALLKDITKNASTRIRGMAEAKYVSELSEEEVKTRLERLKQQARIVAGETREK